LQGTRISPGLAIGVSILALAAAACSYTPVASSYIPRTGTLDIYEPLPLNETRNGRRTQVYMSRGQYGATVARLNEDMLILDLGPQGPGIITIELTRESDRLPKDGGSFELAATDHNQLFDLRGNYDKYVSDAGEREFTSTCTISVPLGQTCEDSEDADGNITTTCRQEYESVQGRQRSVSRYHTSVREVFLQFLEPETHGELARFVESKTTQARSDLIQATGCN
jgi:hypothetical protein